MTALVSHLCVSSIARELTTYGNSKPGRQFSDAQFQVRQQLSGHFQWPWGLAPVEPAIGELRHAGDAHNNHDLKELNSVMHFARLKAITHQGQESNDVADIAR